MSTIAFPRHKFHVCSDNNCIVCNGGLSWCETCGGAEASLPKECPQELMSQEVQDAVQDGRMDYTRKYGWVITVYTGRA